MATELARFKAPPIAEVVLGVQFDPLPAWTSAHAGWFWKSYLGDDRWTKAADTHRLDDVFERPGPSWMKGIQLQAADPKVRTQIVSNDDERLIQLQDTRFIYNWRKRSGRYPSYESLLPDFQQHYSDFVRFVGEAKLGEVKLNQWELIYVDDIRQGEPWSTPADWGAILPSLKTPIGDLQGIALDSLSCNWHFALPDNRGRLHVIIQHARLESVEGRPESLRIQFIARGPLTLEEDYRDGFELGHDASVRCFLAMTSSEAHRHWGRIK